MASCWTLPVFTSHLIYPFRLRSSCFFTYRWGITTPALKLTATSGSVINGPKQPLDVCGRDGDGARPGHVYRVSSVHVCLWGTIGWRAKNVALSSKAAQDGFSGDGGMTAMKNRSSSEETTKGGQTVETSCPPNTDGWRAVSGMCQGRLDGLWHLRNNNLRHIFTDCCAQLIFRDAQLSDCERGSGRLQD